MFRLLLVNDTYKSKHTTPPYRRVTASSGSRLCVCVCVWEGGRSCACAASPLHRGAKRPAQAMPPCVFFVLCRPLSHLRQLADVCSRHASVHRHAYAYTRHARYTPVIRFTGNRTPHPLSLPLCPGVKRCAFHLLPTVHVREQPSCVHSASGPEREEQRLRLKAAVMLQRSLSSRVLSSPPPSSQPTSEGGCRSFLPFSVTV